MQIKGINFIGIDYEYLQGKERAKKIIEKNNIKNGINILLYHLPNISLEDLNDINIFLMLAGHIMEGKFFL